ncbi:MAG: OmpA family protein [Spirochaetes bacterium]|nr:OmpA family protein [Spirochaetota bacterium]
MKNIAVIFAICWSSLLHGYTLSWDIPQGKRLEVVKTADVEYYQDSRFIKRYQERNIVDLTCYEKTTNGGRFKGAFSTFKRQEGLSVFSLEERFYSDFHIARNGEFTVPKQYVMPNVRHMPSFPDGDVPVGSKWEARGEDIILRPFINMQVGVDYFFAGVTKEDTTNIGIINYTYVIDKDVAAKRLGPAYPAKLYGIDYTAQRWDLDRNIPIDANEQYRLLIVQGDNRRGYNSEEYRFNIYSTYRIYDPVNDTTKMDDRAAVEKSLPKNSGVTVDTNERGLVLRMGELLFDFDSDKLRPDSKNALDAIMKVISERYPDREIIVEGYTDNVGSSSYNKTLSESRAKTVAQALKKELGTDKMSFRGYGKDSPIADNATAEGRQKNRRVDVIIKLN